MPASVQKLYTSVAALRRLGPTARLSTSVLAETAPDAAGVVDGDLYLRGSGDPTFDALDAGHLAQQVADAGIVAVTGRVRGDESAFDSRRGVPSSGFRLTWRGRPALRADVQPRPLRPRARRSGRPGRRASPPAAFAKQLRRLGVDVRRRARRRAHARGAPRW